MDFSDEFDEPFFHAPVLEDGLYPMNGFAPLYDQIYNSNNNTEMNINQQEWIDNNNRSGIQWNRNMVMEQKNLNPFNRTGNMESSPLMFMGNNDNYIESRENEYYDGGDRITSSLIPPSSPILMENDESKKKNKKKRKKKVELPNPREISNIEDIKNVLVSLENEQFDDFINKVTKFRDTPLTNEENNTVKDIRRKIKNRESARKCRQNRKSKMGLLEDKIKILKEETFGLQEVIILILNIDLLGYRFL